MNLRLLLTTVGALAVSVLYKTGGEAVWHTFILETELNGLGKVFLRAAQSSVVRGGLRLTRAACPLFSWYGGAHMDAELL